MAIKINDLTVGQLKELQALMGLPSGAYGAGKSYADMGSKHPMLGRRCLVRTYSAGVHIGDVTWINPENAMECKLENALRLWRWEDGGLSLSAVANNGVVKARLNDTGEVMLTGAIEYIPTTLKAEESYRRFIEDAA